MHMEAWVVGVRSLSHGSSRDMQVQSWTLRVAKLGSVDTPPQQPCGHIIEIRLLSQCQGRLGILAHMSLAPTLSSHSVSSLPPESFQTFGQHGTRKKRLLGSHE